MHTSEPAHGHLPPHKEPLEAYSQPPGDAQNRAAQAGHAAAHHVEPAQKCGTKAKRVDEAELKQLVAEENASKAKFPRYPGLERWELVEKMGDGAFSNVYRARDLHGDKGEVAIKVVRKYEMNSMQVSVVGSPWLALPLFLWSAVFAALLVISTLPTSGTHPWNRETTIYTRILKRSRKLQRCEHLFL